MAALSAKNRRTARHLQIQHERVPLGHRKQLVNFRHKHGVIHRVTVKRENGPAWQA
ncbi:MAG: hypothetical protein J6W28_08290 [Clostridia bacterium]|nr:hypothetical protein [Clostridia bacterium]